MIQALEFQRDIGEWLRYLLHVPSAYALRFAVAAGLVLLIIGLLAFGLAKGPEKNPATDDWVLAKIRAGRRTALLLSLFCLLGLILGIQFARFKSAVHPVADKQEPAIRRNPADTMKVWEDPRHGVYHCSGSAWFGKTKGGRVATLRQAEYEGYHPYARPCPVSQTAKPELSR